MKRPSRLFVIALCVITLINVFSILHTGDALKCYVCTSKNNDNVNCTENPPSEEFVENCSTDHCGFIFVESMQTDINLTRHTTNFTKRSCASENFCQNKYQVSNTEYIPIGSYERVCSTCGTDLCNILYNNANVMSSTTAILKCTILVWAIRYTVMNLNEIFIL